MKRLPNRDLLALAAMAALLACSPRTLVVKAVAGAISSESGASGTFASDDDPELVRAAVPFGLKTMEGLLGEQPEHLGLLTSLTGGFTQFAYAFVQADAEQAELAGKAVEARTIRERARRLFLRARDYGLRGLDLRHPGLAGRLRGVRDARAALTTAAKEDLPLVYWTAAAWVLAIANGKNQMDLVAQLPVPEALMDRALELDETWEEGTLHDFYVSYDATRSEAQGGGPKAAKAHLDRSLELSHGKRLGPLVAYAEGALVQTQDRAEFVRVLERVATADAEEPAKYRLANTLAQRRARDLLAHVDDLFP
jgi:predicted anti-sigma-YlaC factor YlaD